MCSVLQSLIPSATTFVNAHPFAQYCTNDLRRDARSRLEPEPAILLAEAKVSELPRALNLATLYPSDLCRTSDPLTLSRTLTELSRTLSELRCTLSELYTAS